MIPPFIVCRSNHLAQGTYAEDVELVRRCLENDSAAISTLHVTYYRRMVEKLLYMRIPEPQAEDVVADVWSDLFTGRGDDGEPLLARYAGKSSLSHWLGRVVRNRLLDIRRRQSHQVNIEPSNERTFRVDVEHRDFQLKATIIKALKMAFDTCEPTAVVMLRLVYIHGVNQREVARVWGWHESKMSRYLSRSMAFIRDETMRRVQEVDPGLKVGWDDILSVCLHDDVNRMLDEGTPESIEASRPRLSMGVAQESRRGSSGGPEES